MKKDIIAMILAGGRGSRLGCLTYDVAKPAVPFGSRYRIIDFPLSNCINSGIDTVGVLTQYQPLALNTYVGNGHPWDLDRNNGGAFILPPYQNQEGSNWYKNTANAIFQNIPFVDTFNPKYVLVLSGDHIYKMNYNKMLANHIKSGSDATIAVYEVPWEQASRFGIMNTNESGDIIEFEEKPAKPKSNLASMGIYIFSWDVLRPMLIEDDANPDSSHDFGKNIIPAFLEQGKKLTSYKFSGYWKDVGTIFSLWEANMDILDYPDQINFKDGSWRIFSRNPVKPSHYLSAEARIVDSAMTDGCVVRGNVEHSVLAHSVIVEEGAVVKNSVLFPGVVVRKGARVEKSIVGFYSELGENSIIGAEAGEKENPYYDGKICSHNISLIDSYIKIKAAAEVPVNSMVTYLEDRGFDDIVEGLIDKSEIGGGQIL